MVNVFEEVNKLWSEYFDDYNKLIHRWLLYIQNGEKTIRTARKQFHQWDPLRIYLSVGKINKKEKPEFSLRFFGQGKKEGKKGTRTLLK